MTDVRCLLACVLEDPEAFLFFMDGGVAFLPSKQANKILNQSRIAIQLRQSYTHARHADWPIYQTLMQCDRGATSSGIALMRARTRIGSHLLNCAFGDV